MSKSLVERIIRADVRAQTAYAVPDARGLVKLDAMENPYVLPQDLRQELAQHLSAVALNRYPVPSYRWPVRSRGPRCWHRNLVL